VAAVAGAGTLAAPDPVLKPGGDPAANTQALQRLIDQPGRTLVRFEAGQYEFADAVRVPADKVLTLDGQGVAQLYRTGYGPVITLTPGGRDWTAGRFTLRDFWAVSGQLTTDGPAQANFLRVERCEFYSPAGYGIDLSTGYCAQPTIADCRFFGGGLRWRYSRNRRAPKKRARAHEVRNRLPG
jgi:hypothetical protein